MSSVSWQNCSTLFSLMEVEGLHRSQGIQQKLTGVHVLMPQEV